MSEYDIEQLAWVREDVELVDRLDASWPGWDQADDRGLEATLAQRPEWSGWADWSDDDKRALLTSSLDEWYPAESAQQPSDDPEDRTAWIREDPALAEHLDHVWPTWEDTGSGLAAYLDTLPDWTGWPAWSDEDKRGYLAQALASWYPQEVPEPAAAEQPATDRLGWVREDPSLTTRLDAHWPGWDDLGTAGLAAYLDTLPDWTGWTEWADDDKRTFLGQGLDAWFSADAGQDATPQDVAAQDAVVHDDQEPEPPASLDEAVEPIAAELGEGLATVLAELLETNPEFAALPQERIAELLSEVLSEEAGELTG